jgi:hypothetical protein
MSTREDLIARRQQSGSNPRVHALGFDTPGKKRVQPATGTELQARRREAAERYLEIATALKIEAGVKRHDVCKELRGLAYCDSGVILAPEGRTRKQLYILAHECAHVALKHGHRRWRKNKPGHVVELEAEQWAHDALRRHGVPVPREMSRRARNYVGYWIAKYEQNGVVVTHEEALRFAGQLTPQRRRALRAIERRPPAPQSWWFRLLSCVFRRRRKSNLPQAPTY